MNNRNITVIIFCVLVISSFLTSCKNDKGFRITGHIEGVEDSTLVKLYDLDNQFFIDSTYTHKGDFILRGQVEEPKTCWLRVDKVNVVISVENVEMTFTGKVGELKLGSSVTGGKEQDLQNELKELQKPYDIIANNAYDSLSNKKYSSDEEVNKLINRYNNANSSSHKIYIDFGKKHYNSYLGLSILYMNRQRISQDSLKTIYQNLTSDLKKTDNAQGLYTFLYEETVKEKQKFIDFTAKTIDGKDFKLSSIKDKYIYLTFWSANCGYCRLENRFLSKNIDSLPKNLEVVSFSLDKNLEDWKKASKKDSVSWVNLSDYKGDKGRVKTIYNVQAMPTSFLIDKNGIVVKKIVGFVGEESFMKELKNLIEKQ